MNNITLSGFLMILNILCFQRIVVTSKTKSVMVKNLSVSTSDVVIKNLCTTVGPVEVCFQTLNPRGNVHMIFMQSDKFFGIT